LSKQSSNGGAPFQNNISALWIGDTTGDKKIKYQGPNNDNNNIFFTTLFHPNNTSFLPAFDFAFLYDNADLNLDGKVKYQGPDNDRNILFFQVLFYPYK